MKRRKPFWIVSFDIRAPHSTNAIAQTKAGSWLSSSLSFPPNPVSLHTVSTYFLVSFSLGGAHRFIMSSIHTALYFRL